MSADRPSLAWAPWLWLTLATIFAHALVPLDSAFARATGSAFSASTVDVTVVPKRKQSIDGSTVEEPAPDPQRSSLDVEPALPLSQSPNVAAEPQVGAALFGTRPDSGFRILPISRLRARAPPIHG